MTFYHGVGDVLMDGRKLLYVPNRFGFSVLLLLFLNL